MLCDKTWLVSALPGAYVSGLTAEQKINLVMSIDSRTIKQDELFVALSGTQADGHIYVKIALERGALGVLISDRSCLNDCSEQLLAGKIIIEVSDTLQALIALAKQYRNQLSIPIIGITGSVGKTSTKGMLQSIFFAAGSHAYVSYKNQNTIIGVCLNLFQVTLEHTCAVFELGIDSPGEMERMVDLLRPTHGLITTLTYAHAKQLGSIENIAREKRMIFKFFTSTNIGVVGGDVPLLMTPGYVHPVARFGLKTTNHVQARKVALIEKDNGDMVVQFMLKWYGKKMLITLPTAHRGMVNNALAAAAMAYQLGLSFESVVQGLENYKGIEQRFELKQIVGNRGMVISDCYNANPESMKAALECFDVMKTTGSKIAVLGDMLELGDREVYWHRRIGRFIRDLSSIDSLILVGKLAEHMAYAIPARITISYAQDWQDACEKLQEQLGEKDSLILVKGSRGIKLDKLVESFEQR